jgi:gluconolactonase
MIASQKTWAERAEHRPAAELRSGFEMTDPAFESLTGPKPVLEKHWSGAEWSEGPVFVPSLNSLVWSDIPNNRMLRFNVGTGETSVFREPSDFSNGNALDLEGRMVTCEHQTHRITRSETDGSVTVLVDRYDGKRLNSPNDLVVKSDGSIWFTDPPYGILSDREGNKRESEIGANYVYRFDPASSELSIVSDQFDKPNGLAFSPDESLLYVADSGEPRKIMVLDVGPDGMSLSNFREFAVVRPGIADGFRCDVNGNVWTSAHDGVHCITPDRKTIGKILVPEQRTANCCWGGPDWNRLYIAADTSVYSVQLAVQGAHNPAG